MKTKVPSALVYGHDNRGYARVKNTIYGNLSDFIDVYFMEDVANITSDFTVHETDVIIVTGDQVNRVPDNLSANILHRVRKIDVINISDIGNFILKEATNVACTLHDEVYFSENRPFFSVFTPAYKTGGRINRLYNSLARQTWKDWEWTVIDDSPASHGETWVRLQQLAKLDPRVKPYRITPNSGGNIGEVKNRACSLSNGKWLVEVDHDDELTSTALEDIANGAMLYPEAGFIYTDCTELYEGDEAPKQYSNYICDRKDWYGKPDNGYVWGFGGHSLVEVDGKQRLWHMQCEINPKTIRYNIGMPNHCRIWRSDVYHKVGGHNKNISVADDYELIVKTFLETKFLHIRKMLYLQWDNRNSTVTNNVIDINRRARAIRDHYNDRIKARFEEMGLYDGEWIGPGKCRDLSDRGGIDYSNEQVANYIIENS
jgi:glycosyltransferase involved in cell wall biosynthesis